MKEKNEERNKRRGSKKKRKRVRLKTYVTGPGGDRRERQKQEE